MVRVAIKGTKIKLVKKLEMLEFAMLSFTENFIPVLTIHLFR